MAVFKLSELRQVKLDATLYNLQYFHKPDNKDIMSVENALRYQQKKHPYISFFIGISNTDSKTAFKYTERTGKRGRPKIKVDGKKVDTHLHIGIMGNAEKSGYSVAKNVSKTINKRLGKKATRVVAMKGADFITYSYRQADSFKQGGDFDFLQCKDDFFLLIE
jgi:hypothetical protein